MARYFFHTRDGDFDLPDYLGQECHSRQEIEERARAAGRMALQQPGIIERLTPTARVEVTDAAGKLVLHLPMHEAVA